MTLAEIITITVAPGTSIPAIPEVCLAKERRWYSTSESLTQFCKVGRSVHVYWVYSVERDLVSERERLQIEP